MNKLARSEDITTDIVGRICEALDVKADDIMDFIPDEMPKGIDPLFYLSSWLEGRNRESGFSSHILGSRNIPAQSAVKRKHPLLICA